MIDQTVARPDGPPLVAPVWYRHTAGAVELFTERSSEKARLLEQAGTRHCVGSARSTRTPM